MTPPDDAPCKDCGAVLEIGSLVRLDGDQNDVYACQECAIGGVQ